MERKREKKENGPKLVSGSPWRKVKLLWIEINWNDSESSIRKTFNVISLLLKSKINCLLYLKKKERNILYRGVNKIGYEFHPFAKSFEIIDKDFDEESTGA